MMQMFVMLGTFVFREGNETTLTPSLWSHLMTIKSG
jgi:hypothetical protein